MANTKRAAKKTEEPSLQPPEVSEDEKGGKTTIGSEQPPPLAKAIIAAPAKNPAAASSLSLSTKSQAARALDTLPVFSKPKTTPLTTPRKKRPSSYGRSCVTLGTRNNISIAWFEIDNSTPCFVNHIVRYLKDNPGWARNKLDVDLIKIRRDPLDENKNWEIFIENPRSSRPSTKRLFTIFIHIPDDINEDGTLFRKRWGDKFVRLHNNDQFMKLLYAGNNKAYYAGDLTPTSGPKPYLSELLTIKSTLEVMKYAWSDVSIKDLLTTNKYLVYFFPPNKYDDVRAYQARKEAHEQEDTIDESDLPSFDDT